MQVNKNSGRAIAFGAHDRYNKTIVEAKSGLNRFVIPQNAAERSVLHVLR